MRRLLALALAIGAMVAVRELRLPATAGSAATALALGFALMGASVTGDALRRFHLPRLTERFYRVDVASSREKGGTGLGLAIVKHILNRHRGELAIASKPGKGSTFTVMLNEARASQAEKGAAAS